MKRKQKTTRTKKRYLREINNRTWKIKINNIVLILNKHTETFDLTLLRIIIKISSQLGNVTPKNMYSIL